MTPIRSLLFVLGAAALPLAAQTSASLPEVLPAPAELAWPTDRVLTDAPGDGSIWATTAAWKAGFDRSGATFVPFLGSDVPSAPTTFRLRAAQVGGHSLLVREAMPRLDGQRVSFARGDVLERYDLQQAGLEQSFVLAELPQRGDLQLEIAVQTALGHRHDGGEHCFVGAHGGIRYGAAVAIDARGERLPLTTTWTEDALRITVPASFVATAALPLVVDPLDSSAWAMPTTTSVAALSSTDIAWDHSLQQFFVTYERAFSSTDHDVYVVWTNANLQPQGMLTIDFTSTYWSRPRVATLEAHDVGCVVAETSTSNQSPFNVSLRRFFGGAAPTTMPVQVVPVLGGVDRSTPDIGGDADPVGPAQFLVAYSYVNTGNGEGGVNAATYSPTGNQNTIVALDDAIGFARRPAVSKHCGAPGSPNAGWSVVYRREVPGQVTGVLMHSFVHRDGTRRFVPAVAMPVGPATPNSGSEWDVSPPTDSGSPVTYLCVERRLDAATMRHGIHGHAVSYLGSNVAPSLSLMTLSADRKSPAVTTDGARFAVAVSSEFTNNDHDVSVATWAVVGGALTQHDFAVVSYASDADIAPSVCSMMGAGRNDYGIAFVRQTGNQWTVHAQRYYGVDSGGLSQRNTGCGSLAINALGSTALGESFGLALAGVVGVPAFLVGPPVAYTLPGCAGCTIGADQLLLAGNQLAITVPVDVDLVGAQLSFQGVQLLAGPGPCLGQFELSHTIDARLR